MLRQIIALGIGTHFMSSELPFLSNSFDVVTSFGFFSLLPKQIWSPIIQEMYRIVKPGGIILIEANSPFHGVFLALYRYLFKKRELLFGL